MVHFLNCTSVFTALLVLSHSEVCCFRRGGEGCAAFYLFFSVSGTLHLSEKDSLRKVKVQKDSLPIGNKPSLRLHTGLLTPHSWVGFMAEGKLIIVGWLGDQLLICTYSCHQPLLCFPCDSFISGAIATGLGCTHDEVPRQTEFKAPLALQWIRRNSLFKYLPADPELAKTGRNFPPGLTGS